MCAAASKRAAQFLTQPFEEGSSLGRRSRAASLHPQTSATGGRSDEVSVVAERPAGDAPGDAGLVEVPRDPAAEERVSRAEDQAASISAALATTPSSRICRASSASASRIRSWISSTARASVALLERRRIAVRECLKRRRRAGTCRGSGVQRLEDVVRDAEGRPSRGAPTAASGSRAGARPRPLLDVSTALERLHQDGRLARQHPVHDERRRILHEHPALAELPGDVPGGGEGPIVRRRRPDDLDQGEDGDGVEEVEPDDPLRVLEPSAIAATESADAFVTSRQSDQTTRLQRAEAPRRFTSSSSNTASSTRSQPAYASVPFRR